MDATKNPYTIKNLYMNKMILLKIGICTNKNDPTKKWYMHEPK